MGVRSVFLGVPRQRGVSTRTPYVKVPWNMNTAFAMRKLKVSEALLLLRPIRDRPEEKREEHRII